MKSTYLLKIVTRMKNNSTSPAKEIRTIFNLFTFLCPSLLTFLIEHPVGLKPNISNPPLAMAMVVAVMVLEMAMMDAVVKMMLEIVDAADFATERINPKMLWRIM